MKLPSRLLLAVAAALIVGQVISCGVDRPRPNVLIIAVDTLRSDHLGCYGYERPTSPNIDHLAARSVLFEDAVSQSPWTLPSFASMFTSLYPTQHGANDFSRTGAGSFGNRMSSSFPPLAMMLLKHGYSTGAIVNAPALAPELGVDRGFEFYSTTARWNKRKADATTDAALKWIDETGDGPFFIFVHYFDPHLDYEPPPPYDTMFDPDYQGSIGSTFTLGDYHRMEEALSKQKDPYAQAEWDHIRALYDGEILFTDNAVGELLEGLEARGLVDNMLIVFLSDHGEEFFDHKGFEHGHTLYDELIKVPLLFSLPGRLPRGKRIGTQVRIVDVVPTILEIIGIRPETHLEGTSLLQLATGEGGVESQGASLLPPGFAYSESLLYGNEKKSVTAHPWKLVYDTITEEEKLFNLADDPEERTNLARREPETLGLMEEILFKTMLSISDTWYVEVEPGRVSHTFDLALSVSTAPMNGRFKLHKFLDPDGRVVHEDSLPLEEPDDDVIRLEELELDSRLTLAIKAAPKRVPVRFDFRIDGKPARDITYLGEDLVKPEAMPFEQRAGKARPSHGEASSRPQPPYILVWHSGTQFEPAAQVELGEDTKQQLKALGYIQ